MKGRYVSLLSLVFILALFAAGSGAEEAKKTQSCTQCGMKIDGSIRKFTVIDTGSMEKTAFEDIGCAALWWREQCVTRMESFERNALVHDYYTEEPVPLMAASYVADSGVKTPRGYGIVAFKNKAGAERFIVEQAKGRVITADDLYSLKLETRN